MFSIFRKKKKKTNDVSKTAVNDFASINIEIYPNRQILIRTMWPQPQNDNEAVELIKNIVRAVSLLNDGEFDSTIKESIKITGDITQNVKIAETMIKLLNQIQKNNLEDDSKELIVHPSQVFDVGRLQQGNENGN